MSDSASTPPPISTTTTMNGDKLSGQLIIKAQLGDDIRKMMIHNEDLTLNELLLMMERVFVGKISNSDEITIKYLDDDGDKITLSDDSDLTVALHFHKILRLFVFINGKEQANIDSTENLNEENNLIDAKNFQNELKDIRNAVQTILERLQQPTNENLSSPPPPSSSSTTETVPSSTVVSNTTREFDPYKNPSEQQQQQQHSVTSSNNQSNSNHFNNTDHQTSAIDTNQVSSSTYHQTPQYTPTNYNNDQQNRTNVFGPPTTLPTVPPLPNNTTPRYPPATTPNRNTPPSFIGQQAGSSPLPQGGFYAQQQRQTTGTFSPNNTFTPQQSASPPPSNAAPGTFNPSFAQPPPPPPTISQQPYGGYPPQNSYYNPYQQYPKPS